LETDDRILQVNIRSF